LIDENDLQPADGGNEDDDDDDEEAEARRAKRRYLASMRPISIERLAQGMNDSKLLYSLSSSHALSIIKIWSLETLRCTRRIPVESASSNLSEVSPRLLVTDVLDTNLALWDTTEVDVDTEQPQVSSELQQQQPTHPTLASVFDSAHRSCVSSIVRMSIGRFATSSFDGYVKLWAVESTSTPTSATKTLKCVAQLFGHLEEIYSLSLVSVYQNLDLEPQQLLLSCSKDESVRLWQRVINDNSNHQCVDLYYCPDRPNLSCQISSILDHELEHTKVVMIAIAYYGSIVIYSLQVAKNATKLES